MSMSDAFRLAFCLGKPCGFPLHKKYNQECAVPVDRCVPTALELFNWMEENDIEMIGKQKKGRTEE